MFKEEHLVDSYKRTLLKYCRLNDSNKLPLNLIKKNDLDEKHFSILNAFFRLSEELNIPVYKSRQDFIKEINIDKNKNFLYSLNFVKSDQTLSGSGSCKEDPFYDRNCIVTQYIIDNEKYTRLIIDKKARFFNCFYNSWGDYNNREKYLFSIDLSLISISEFNDLFSVQQDFKSEEYQRKFSDFLDKILIIEHYEGTDKTIESIEFNENEQLKTIIKNNHNLLILDENEKIIEDFCYNHEHYSAVTVNDLLLFDNGWRIVTDISVVSRETIGVYTKVKTKKYIGEVPIY
ncbi:MAG: hypothetical protein CL760_10690 [Chloroflexi bacterium]|nr:hypothetical protein [Chloroflexota bacterium]|tara:strand:+ start:42691 stop:43557 length:867 start_codon:yes stop_codon:yes gene_type:complete